MWNSITWWYVKISWAAQYYTYRNSLGETENDEYQQYTTDIGNIHAATEKFMSKQKCKKNKPQQTKQKTESTLE